jgi:hypothetical protein
MLASRPVRRSWRISGWLFGSLLVAASAAAQDTSGINGRVTDSTSGALPGVTVTVSSPALQVPTLTTVTSDDGSYRFLQLPAGTYEARYELAGFRTAVRRDIRLTVGFTATINTSLELGGIAESIAVDRFEAFRKELVVLIQPAPSLPVVAVRDIELRPGILLSGIGPLERMSCGSEFVAPEQLQAIIERLLIDPVGPHRRGEPAGKLGSGLRLADVSQTMNRA